MDNRNKNNKNNKNYRNKKKNKNNKNSPNHKDNNNNILQAHYNATKAQTIKCSAINLSNPNKIKLRALKIKTSTIHNNNQFNTIKQS